ncbi:MAG: TPR end-of-group domain-containing protein [Myxococcota bacterium]
MTRTARLFPLVVLFSCVGVKTAAPTPSCAELPGAELLTPGGLFVFGELHGTRELPAAVGELACHAARRGRVVVGLELKADPSFAAFEQLQGEALRRGLLAGPAWSTPMQDGRTSTAMLALLERLAGLRAAGAPIELLLFDADASGDVTRDQAMAALVRARRAATPGATMLVLTGNLHALKTKGSPWKRDDAYEWMSSLLPDATTFDASTPLGTAWVCSGQDASSCGARVVQARPGAARTTALSRRAARGYDGVLDVGALTASPPALGAPADFDATLARLMTGPDAALGLALADYEQGDFAGCAARLDKLPAPGARALYSHACCLARAGRVDDAFDKLRGALAAGLKNRRALEQDEDLAPLRADPRWGALLTTP